MASGSLPFPESLHRFRWPGEDDRFIRLDQGTLEQIGTGDHQFDQFIFGLVGFGETERFVRLFFRAQDFPGAEPALFQ